MRSTFSIAINTWRELVRGKALYSTLFFALAVVLVSALFGSVTIGDQVQVIRDFGLFSISLFSAAFAVIAGASLLHKELSRKTIFNILARPVERWEFLAGKFFGMLLTAGVMILLMGLLLVSFLAAFTAQVDFVLIYALLYVFFETAIVCAAAIFFSALVVTPALNGLFSFGLFLAGRSAEYVLYFVKEGLVDGYPAQALQLLYYALPHLSTLNASSQMIVAETVAFDPVRVLWSLLYTGSYAAVLLLLANLIFARREFY